MHVHVWIIGLDNYYVREGFVLVLFYCFEPVVFNLQVIVPEKCSVELLGTKAEIKLKKADIVAWKTLHYKESGKN